MTDRDPRFSENQQENQAPENSEGGYVIENPSVIYPLNPQEQKPAPRKGNLHLFSGFCENPDKIFFHDQEPNEEILLFLRKSQIVNIGWILLSILLLIAPFFLFLLPPSAIPFVIPQKFGLILLLFYLLAVVTYAFVNFIIWYYNAALITNRRIVDIDFHQLVHKDVAETKLSLVQDVSYRQESVIENFFDYGHVLIQTAGTVDNFEFNSLPKPERIEEIVNDLIGKGRVYVP